MKGVQQHFLKGSPACKCGPDAPAEDCAYHGRTPYMVCERCNYDTHECPGCGAPLEHPRTACDHCTRELLEQQAAAVEQ